MKNKAVVALGTLALAAGAILTVPTASFAAPPLRIATQGNVPGNNPTTIGPIGPGAATSGQAPTTTTGDTGVGARQPMPSSSPSPMASGSPMASPEPTGR